MASALSVLAGGLALSLLPGCSASMPKIPSAGSFRVKTEIRDTVSRRSYVVHVPPGYDADRRFPLVIVLHGAFSTARKVERYSGFSDVADEAGFLVVYPEGYGFLGFLQHWNAGHCCGRAASIGVDDVGFVRTVLDDVRTRLSVDSARVFLVGESNGGILAHHLAAEWSEEIAGLGVVSGSIGGRPASDEPEMSIPPPKRRVPVVLFHGREDPLIPYLGGIDERSGIGRTFLSPRLSAETWARSNGCDGPPTSHAMPGKNLRCEAWTSGEGCVPVVLYTIEGWGHAWPSPEFVPDAGEESLGPGEVARRMWAFFSGRQSGCGGVPGS